MSQSDAIPLPTVLWRRLSALGIDLDSLLREAGLPPDLLSESKPKVSTAGFFALWRALEHLDSDPAFGLRLAHEASADQLDVASIAAMHAPTFEEALAKLARYKRLVCPEEVRIQPVVGGVGVTFSWWLSQDAPPPRLIDACLASVLVLGCSGTGQDLRPVRVELARPRAHRPLLEAHFGCPVRFRSAVNRIVFAPAALALPFQTTNPDLLAILLPGLEAALATVPGHHREGLFADQVRRILRAQMQGRRPTLQAVAGALALSPRSLQRRLMQSGTSYQRMLDEVRETVACELLGRTDLESGEIAFLLGFEELNSFHRAFSVWRGTTPSRWRQQVQRPSGT